MRLPRSWRVLSLGRPQISRRPFRPLQGRFFSHDASAAAAAAAFGGGPAGRSPGAVLETLHEDAAAGLAAEALRVVLEICPARLAFRHPADGRRMEFTSELPEDLRRVLDELSENEDGSRL